MIYTVEWDPGVREKVYIYELVRNGLGISRAIEADAEMSAENFSTHFCYIKEGDDVVACAAVGKSPFYSHTWWLGFSVVAETHRNRGLADTLITSRLRFIKENGGTTVFAATVGDGHRLKRHGFEFVKQLSPTHTLLMAELDARSS